MSFFSSRACSTRIPALNVRSNTLPFLTLRSLVRTNAPPLPGLTCWNSTTWNSPLSSSRVIPFFRSLVVMAGTVNPSAMQSVPAAVVGHDHEVFDTDTAESLTIDPRFDGHYVPDLQFQVTGAVDRTGLRGSTGPRHDRCRDMNHSP